MSLTITDNKNIQLDEVPITLEQLMEARNNKTVRIIEIAPNRFKTLQKLEG